MIPTASRPLCSIVLLAAFGTGIAWAQDTRQDVAHDEYQIGHYDKAFALFAELADQGDCDAARIARQMVRHGRTLYSTDFPVTAERLARWQRSQGCPTVVVVRR